MIEVESILRQRYPRFFAEHRRSAHTLSRLLGLLFHESRFQQFERDHPHLEGFEFVEAVLRYFSFSLRLRDNERARIPHSGAVVIVANHPIGSLDGLALLQLVREVRPDVRVVANDLLAEIKPLRSVLLPVNNMGGNTPRANLKNILRHLQAEGALIIFPAGEVSRLGPRGIRDSEWQSGFIKIAMAARSPVLPLFVAGRNSLLFYSISLLARPLSTIWLVREMFKQSHNVVDVRVGNPIPYLNYAASAASAKKLASLFRKHVYRLARDGRPLFQGEQTIAYPENRLLLRREVARCEQLGKTPDGKQICLYRPQPGDCVMREVGRLRELTFRTVGEGTGFPRDIDRFDRDYFQLLLWDPEQLEIAGAYRLGSAGDILAERGPDGLYTHTLFEFGEPMYPLLEQGLELGRSFVQPRYQGRRSLDYLWWGIGAFLQRYPRYRYLFGPVSISRFYGELDTASLVYYYGRNFGDGRLAVRARTPFSISAPALAELAATYGELDREEGFRRLRKSLDDHGLAVPPLYKHYMEAAYPDGVHVAAFNVDPEFGDCVDGFVLVDLTRLKPQKQKRYLGREDYFGGSTTTRRHPEVPHAVDIRRASGQQPLQGAIPAAVTEKGRVPHDLPGW
jgi:putative hemolysin